MRYPTGHKEETRERILKAASRRFRSRGSEGAAIDDLMRDLKLTRGGFYRHFASKEELFAAVFDERLAEASKRILASVEKVPQEGRLAAFIGAYLSLEHCEDAADGCPVAALASELARRPARSPARAAFQRLLKERVQRVAPLIPGDTEEERAAKARTLMSGMAGTLAVARALTDDQARRKLLEDSKKFYLAALQK